MQTCRHKHPHEKVIRGNFLILFTRRFSLISFAELLCHSLNLNSVAPADRSKWKEEADAGIAGVGSQPFLSLCWLLLS